MFARPIVCRKQGRPKADFRLIDWRCGAAFALLTFAATAKFNGGETMGGAQMSCSTTMPPANFGMATVGAATQISKRSEQVADWQTLRHA